MKLKVRKRIPFVVTYNIHTFVYVLFKILEPLHIFQYSTGPEED